MMSQGSGLMVFGCSPPVVAVSLGDLGVKLAGSYKSQRLCSSLGVVIKFTRFSVLNRYYTRECNSITNFLISVVYFSLALVCLTET